MSEAIGERLSPHTPKLLSSISYRNNTLEVQGATDAAACMALNDHATMTVSDTMTSFVSDSARARELHCPELAATATRALTSTRLRSSRERHTLRRGDRASSCCRTGANQKQRHATQHEQTAHHSICVLQLYAANLDRLSFVGALSAVPPRLRAALSTPAEDAPTFKNRLDARIYTHPLL